MNNLVLIDGNAIIHRAYHSMPKTFTDPKGNPTNAVYGFALALIRVIEDLKPNYVVCSFDLAGPTFRHHKFEDYKATRVKADQELYDQIPPIKELVKAFGIHILEKQGFEADDVIGTVVKRLSPSLCHSREGGNPLIDRVDSRLRGNDSGRGGNDNNESMKQSNNDIKTYIVTGDKDAYQLVNGEVFIYDLKQGAGSARIINRQVIKAKYDLEPEDFIDLKALAGDPSDNIPGVPGIGDKTATSLIQQYQSVDNLYAEIQRLARPLEKNFQFSIFNFQSIPNDSIFKEIAKQMQIKERTLKLLIEHKDQAYLSQELATIHKDVPLTFTLEELKWGEYDKETLRALFEKLGFRSLLARFGRASDGESHSAKASSLRQSYGSGTARDAQEARTVVQKKDQQLKLL